MKNWSGTPFTERLELADTPQGRTLSGNSWPWDSIRELLIALSALLTFTYTLCILTHTQVIQTSTSCTHINKPPFLKGNRDPLLNESLTNHLPQENKWPETGKQLPSSHTGWFKYSSFSLLQTTYARGNPLSAGSCVQHNDLSGCLSVSVSVFELSTLGRHSSHSAL